MIRASIEFCPSRNGYVMSVPHRGLFLIRVPRDMMMLELTIVQREMDIMETYGGRVIRTISEETLSRLTNKK